MDVCRQRLPECFLKGSLEDLSRDSFMRPVFLVRLDAMMAVYKNLAVATPHDRDRGDRFP